MDKDLYEHYKAILAAEKAETKQLEIEKQRIEAKIETVRASIARIVAKLTTYEEAIAAKPMNLFSPPSPSAVPERLKYAGMSVRWAILNLMADGGVDQLGTTNMAAALLAGGVRSNGQNFNANVSAVVSEMHRQKNELAPGDTDGTYRITPHGREVWESIKHTAQYRFARLAVASGAATESNQ
jgi:hypothetical protein